MAGVAWNHPSGGISGHTFDDLVEFAWNRRKEYVYIYIIISNPSIMREVTIPKWCRSSTIKSMVIYSGYAVGLASCVF